MVKLVKRTLMLCLLKIPVCLKFKKMASYHFKLFYPHLHSAAWVAISKLVIKQHLLSNWSRDLSLVCLPLVFICAHLYHSTQLKLRCLVTHVFYIQLSLSTFFRELLLTLKNLIEANWDRSVSIKWWKTKFQIISPTLGHFKSKSNW